MNPGEYRRMYEVEDRHWWYVGLHGLVLQAVRAEARRLGRPLRLLDAGCGTGRLCQLLAAEGHQVVGCDASPEALRLARQRGVEGLFEADLNAYEPAPGRYDAITSIDVLYHAGIADDVAVLRRLRRGLRPGGLLVLNLVAFEFLRSTHDVAVHTRERYTRPLLRRRLEVAGLEPERVGYRVCLPFPLVAASRLWARLVRPRRRPPAEAISDVAPPGRAVNALLLGALRLENRLLHRMALPFGSSVFALGRRPPEASR